MSDPAWLPSVRGLIIDLDGVLWRGAQPLPGLQPFFGTLRQRRLPFVLATNNATAAPARVAERLAGYGVRVEAREVLTSSEAAAALLRQRFPAGTPVLPVGEAGLRAALAEAGFELLDHADGAEAVVVALDRSLTWGLLTEACLAIRAGALFVGANPDVTFPTERGLAPGSGALLAAIQAATGTAPLIVGKPEPPLFQAALARLGLPAEEVLAVGDRLETDILGAQRAGLRTALVLTGVTAPDELARSPLRPDGVFLDLPDLTRALAAAA